MPSPPPTALKMSAPLTTAFINARIWGPPALKTKFKTSKESSDIPPKADALGVVGNKIAIIGKEEEIRKYCNTDTRIIDAKRGMLIPGFTDSHCHFLDGGYRLLSVQLRHCKSEEQFKRTLSEFVKGVAPGEWVIGGDWDHQLWGGVLPTRKWIDDVSPRNPVWLNRLDGHMYSTFRPRERNYLLENCNKSRK